ncbi:hypothetical protein L1987_20550 [Smallanthus sonchifolius]|uniref:Uncharacterized protein n=1 Tax=Smallanthus sonchifolius TaxID=185202 RepID=A0ACB9ISK7_9ASTR|nr:hypothetical protein L1987_20550 [Smallanthus sonchifolius]
MTVALLPGLDPFKEAPIQIEIHDHVEPEINVSTLNEINEPTNAYASVSVKDKHKTIATEEESIEIPVQVDREFDKEIEDELTKGNLLEMQTKAYFAEIDEKVEMEAKELEDKAQTQ